MDASVKGWTGKDADNLDRRLWPTAGRLGCRDAARGAGKPLPEVEQQSAAAAAGAPADEASSRRNARLLEPRNMGAAQSE